MNKPRTCIPAVIPDSLSGVAGSKDGSTASSGIQKCIAFRPFLLIVFFNLRLPGFGGAPELTADLRFAQLL